jgi:hypothetical protein
MELRGLRELRCTSIAVGYRIQETGRKLIDSGARAAGVA